MSDKLPETMSISEAGRHYYGLCRNASYAAAERGELPLVKVGKLLRVPVRQMERILDRAGAPAPRSPQSVRVQASLAAKRATKAKAEPDATVGGAETTTTA